MLVTLISASQRFSFSALYADHQERRLITDKRYRVVRDSYLRDDLTPFDLYMKFLIEYFGPAIEYDPNVESYLPKGVKSLSYQADAVNDGWQKLWKRKSEHQCEFCF